LLLWLIVSSIFLASLVMTATRFSVVPFVEVVFTLTSGIGTFLSGSFFVETNQKLSLLFSAVSTLFYLTQIVHGQIFLVKFAGFFLS